MQKINKQKKQGEQVQRLVCAEIPSRYSIKLQLFVEDRSLIFCLSLLNAYFDEEEEQIQMRAV